uniref:T9SS type A sorting domain-containing protein n=1 Tax=Winogradskyella aurantiaca TaxID=2219558 RepID=UPI001300A29B
IGSWVDGDITISNDDNTYNYSVTEFDNIVADIAFGTYDYTFVRSGGCYPEVTGSLTVDCDAIDPISSNIFLGIVADQAETTSAAVFVSTSSHPLIGSWVDGDITISNDDNTYNYSVTEFDNIVADIAFGTYDYTFVRSGGCYPEVTGSITVDCNAIDPNSSNIFLGIVADQAETTSAAVFVSTSSHPLIGSWVDGDITISNADNTYNYSVTEFDNIVADIAFGTYDYTFVRSGGCYPEVTGSITVDCDAIDPISSNIFLGIVADQAETTSAAVFVSTSSHPLIGSWVDGDITISNDDNTYNYSVTEFDNIVADIAFGTYDYTFVRSGGCYPEVTGSITVDCDAIDPISSNIFLGIVADQPEIVLDTTVEQTDNVLTANAVGDTITYQWVDCDNSNAPIDGATNQEFTAETNGSYAVVITDSRCGLTETSDCFVVASLSLDETPAEMVWQAYPNPFTDSIQLSFNRVYESVEVAVYSMEGKLMGSYQINQSQELRLDTSHLSSGTYLINVLADGQRFSEMMIKQ